MNFDLKNIFREENVLDAGDSISIGFKWLLIMNFKNIILF